MARPVDPSSRGLAQFIDEIEVPSILRHKRQTGLSCCAPCHTQKLTREIEHLPWRGSRGLRDDNWRNNPLHRGCRPDVIIERPRRGSCGDVADSRVMTCHDLVAYSRPRRRHRLNGLDWLRRLEDP